MKTMISAVFLATALAASVKAQIDFDSGTGASLASLIAEKGGAAAPVPAPARALQPASGSCESFSVEGTMRSIPIYDQIYSAGEEGESNICYAVVAAAMMDHWNLSNGGGSGSGELISPLLLEMASARRSGEGRNGGELTQDALYRMAGQDACTLGVTAGSRSALTITEEGNMIKRGVRASDLSRGGETAFGKSLSADDARDSLTDKNVSEKSSGDGESYNKGQGGSSDDRGQGAQCRRVQVAPFTAQYQRTRRVSDGSGGTRGVRMTAEDIRAFMTRNTANQPVGIKFRYDAVFGEPPADSGSPHWALIIARQMRGGTCQYLIRNSYGADHTQAWVDEARLAYTAASLAVLGR